MEQSAGRYLRPEHEKGTEEMMFKGIDTAAPISEAAARKLKELGYSFVGRYIVPAEGGTKWKALTQPEANIIRDAGLSILLCWETTATRAKAGVSAGAYDGTEAMKLAKAMNIPNETAICFAIDYDAPPSDWAKIEAYLRGARWNIGDYKLGMYAPARVLNHFASIGVDGKPLIAYGWQCYAWSYGQRADVAAYQTAWQGDAAAKALEKQLGFAVDLDEATTLEGMWNPKSAEEYALEWAKDITDDPKIAMALWRYHFVYGKGESK